MNRKLFLLLSIVVSAASAAFPQSKAPERIAVRWIVGESGAALTAPRPEPAAPRPERARFVSRPVEGAKASVAVNIKSAERIAFDLINQKRASAGLRALTWSDQLEAVARLHSADMAANDYFSHRSPQGKMVSDRADDARVGNWRAIGENIAFNRGYQDPVERAVELWMNSPSHRTNLMSDSWKESAVGVAISEDGSYYFTQVFLKR